MKIIGIERRLGLGMNTYVFRLPWQTRLTYYQLPATVEIDSYWEEIKFTNGVCRQAPQKGWCISWDKVWHAEDEEVVQAIGRYDFEMCEKILSRNEESLARIVKKVYGWIVS